MTSAITLLEITQKFGGELMGEDRVVKGVGSIQSASDGDIAFCDHPKYEKYVAQTNASALIVPPSLAQASALPKIVTDNPKLVFAKVVATLKPEKRFSPGVHPTAVVDQSASIGQDVHIGPHCVVESGVTLGDGVVLEAHCVIGENTTIGAKSHLYPRVVVYHSVHIGECCQVHSGTVIGSDGFGYANDRGNWVKLPQVGSVRIGNQVEIGSNTTIDRGALEDTIIEDGVILDNLIQVAHNVKIGRHTAVSAQAGFAGSCQVGAYCMIGGSSVFNGHISIADKSVFIPGSQLANSVKKPDVFASAIPARPRGQWAKNTARFHRLDDMAVKINQVQRQVKALEKAVEESGA